METKIRGKLEFISLFEQVKLFTNNETLDLRDSFFQFFQRMNGVPTKMDAAINYITFKEDNESEYDIKFDNSGGGLLICLNKRDGFGFSNIGAYLPDMLQRLNARNIIVTIGEKYLHIEPDVHAEGESDIIGLYYTKNNSCKIPNDAVKSVCKIGTNDCCIFVSSGGNGFECLKFDSFSARNLLDRYSKKQMNASRIGNCTLLGRNETLNDGNS